MNDKLKSIFLKLHTWQLVLLSVLGAVMITNSLTIAVSYLVWDGLQLELIALGTANAMLVPALIMPPLLRLLRKTIHLEEQKRNHQTRIMELEDESESNTAIRRRADEMELLYRLGISLTSGKNLYDTLLALQAEIIKLIRADAFYVAIYDQETDIASYPIFFNEGEPVQEADRYLHEWPGLTGAVIFGGKTLYLPDMFDPIVEKTYRPHDTNDLILHTFLGIPLSADGQVFGMLSVQSKLLDAYTADQIRLMENVAIQAATSIYKTRLLDQLKQELAERKRAEEQLREREMILESTTFAAEQFLKTPDWRTNIDLVLERLGKTLNITHAYLFEDHIGPEGEELTSMRYEWTAPGYPSDLGSQYFQNSRVDKQGFEDQVAALSRGDARIGNASTFGSIEKEDMDSLGVKSILEVPIFVNDKEWGAVGFDDLEKERVWSTAEVDVLKIAAGVLSAAIQRQKADSALQESERIYRQAIEAAGAVPYYQDHRIDHYVFMGQGIEKITGYTPEEMSASLWNSIVQEEQLVGDLSGSDVHDASQRARTDDFDVWKCDYRIRSRDGQMKWIADTAVAVFDEGGVSHTSIGIMQDITERKLIEAGLRQREAILETAAFAAGQFIESSDWRARIDLVLERLGRTIHATHAYLFEHHPGAAGKLISSMRYEWSAPGYPNDLENPDFQGVSLEDEGFESYFNTLKNGEPFIGNLSTFLPAEKEFFVQTGIKSMVEVPLLVDGKWWGTIGFDDFENEREWSNGEVDALKIAAGILGGAIQREIADSAVQESERIYRQTIEAAGAVPYYQDYEKGRYTFFGEGIRQITGYGPNEITPDVWHGMVQETILIGELAGLSEEEAIQRVRSGANRGWKCDYRIRTPDGHIRWVADTSIELFGEQGLSYGSIGIMQDITDRKQTEASLRQREAVLEAVTFAAEKFLKSSDWRANIDVALERLGKSFDATHTYLFEHHLDANGQEVSSLRYEWTAPGFISDLDNPLFQSSHLLRDGVDSTDDTLRQGEAFVGNSSTFPEIEKERLAELGIKAMMEVPLFVNGNWWGTIGFDDMVNERDWNISDVGAIKIAADILSAAIQRDMAESAIRESERIYRQAISAAGAVPYYRDYEENRYTFMGEGIERIIGYAPEEVTVDLWMNLIQESVPLSEELGMQTGTSDMSSSSGVLKVWKSDIRVFARNGEERWVTDSAVELFGDSDMPYASVGILQDVTDRKKTEAGLRKRESILAAITFAAEQFLKTSNWHDTIDIVLQRLGEEFNASHAYLFEKHMDEQGLPLTSMTHEWTAPGNLTDLNDPDFQNMPPKSMGFERMYEILDRGEPLIGSASFINDVEREYLNSIGVKALLEMRIIVDGNHLGTIGFDDTVREREWTTMEVDVIRVAANVLGAAIKRQMDEDALKRELAERRRTEQALKLSEERFSKVFHTTPVMMTLEDAEGRLVEVNHAFLEALGYEREEVIGHRPFEFNLVPDASDKNMASRLQKEKGTFKDLELRIRRKSGETCIVLMSIEYIHVNDVSYVLTSALDITERKRAEQKYRDIFNNSIDGIFQSTEDGHFLSVNPAMARIYGYDSPEEMLAGVGDIVKQLYVYPEQRAEVLQRLSSGERLIGYETLDYRRDGSTFWASMSAQAIFDESGRILYYEGTVEDITSRKQSEAEREGLIRELAKKNAELEQFTYTVSHDLKSPLVTISGFLGYLEQDALSGNIERLKKDMRRIQEAVYKMQRLLNELLELSRIGRMMNMPEPIPFDELIREAVEIVHGRLEEHGVSVHVHPNLSTVYGDRPRLVEVLQNLIDNAAKYMGDQNAPSIEIGQRGEENGMPVFFVKDNGMGIAPEHHERVFGLFNKLDAKSEGTGVGLALVKRIIEVHGGRIWVESEPGMGAAFLFTLPSSGQAKA